MKKNHAIPNFMFDMTRRKRIGGDDIFISNPIRILYYAFIVAVPVFSINLFTNFL